MVQSDHPPANGFVAFMRKIYNPIGFSKGYNALFWFIFDGALFGFVLARLQYLSFWGVFCNQNATNHSTSGECYWYTSYSRSHIGLIIHLSAILPAALLAVFQFIPFIRHRALLYHRLAGWVITLLVLISNGSAIAIANHAFGGDVATRMFTGILALATTISLALSLINIKRVQIDQHRAWMLRTWAYLASIITLRIIQILMISISAAWPAEATQYTVIPCAEILVINNNNTKQTYAQYPGCNPAAPAAYQYAGGMAPVRADFLPVSGTGTAASVQAMLSTNFGAAGFLAFVIHVVLVELYLQLTPREGERLRRVSYERQLERGFKNPGSAGLVAQRLGDADTWVPDREMVKVQRGERGEAQEIEVGK